MRNKFRPGDMAQCIAGHYPSIRRGSVREVLSITHSGLIELVNPSSPTGSSLYNSHNFQHPSIVACHVHYGVDYGGKDYSAVYIVQPPSAINDKSWRAAFSKNRTTKAPEPEMHKATLMSSDKLPYVVKIEAATKGGLFDVVADRLADNPGETWCIGKVILTTAATYHGE